jgi:hypothetical protein
MRSLILTSLLSLASLAFSQAQLSAPSSSCKAVPGSPNWPADEEWAGLYKAVGGRLLKPAPPASVCHRGWDNYNAGDCADLNAQWKNSGMFENLEEMTSTRNDHRLACRKPDECNVAELQ